jgi:two-component system NtrC family sensor kinase
MIVYRGSRDLFHPIERIHHVVKSVHAGRDKRIGQLGLDDEHELTQLARQFDNMLDLLAQRNAEICQAADQLESKVERRTAKLHEKTEQLELHIKLLNQTRDKLVVNEKLAALGERADSIEEEIDTILNQIDRIRNISRSLLQYIPNQLEDAGLRT